MPGLYVRLRTDGWTIRRTLSRVGWQPLLTSRREWCDKSTHKCCGSHAAGKFRLSTMMPAIKSHSAGAQDAGISRKLPRDIATNIENAISVWGRGPSIELVREEAIDFNVSNETPGSLRKQWNRWTRHWSYRALPTSLRTGSTSSGKEFWD
jgi:hypothetical protein